ncbi:hypothetical protein E8E13_011052 [Curvularia kusanoi]|uniref:Uncharacterized protein n=1 Tax=Curvularia kusanoi TaxID=90978 RepID=A0A9P4TKJ6_CURKU|nr:hypothetical protein E8E13_011052 [Curvularia kusanoi]
MTLAGDDRGRTNGLDMKITAVQLYTQALEGLAEQLEEAKKIPSVLVATLCLMAFFESFCGNIPAFIGRIQAANYYCSTLLPVCTNVDLPPLRDCLRSLSRNCYVTLPLDIIQRTTEQHLDDHCFEAMDPERSSSTSLMALDSLVNMISDDYEMKELMWSPIAAYSRLVPARTLSEYEQKLVQWRDSHLEIIPELDTESALQALLVYGWSQFAIPPPPYTTITSNKSLAAAYYNFYRARIRWALVLLDEDVLRNKTTAEFYFYEALRHAASHAAFLTSQINDEDTYVPCETLNIGLLPVLHIIGLCSPQPLWLEWIHDLCDRIAQEGVVKGHTFATSLDCLHRLEMHRYDGGPSAKMDRYPDPAERIICQLIPETDGRHFVAYFAAPVAALDPRHAGLNAYEVIGDARWACGYEDGPCTPVVTVYDNGQTNLKTFSKEWLYNTQPVIEWLSWSQEREFCIERAVQDHISGTRLLLAAEGAINNEKTET